MKHMHLFLIITSFLGILTVSTGWSADDVTVYTEDFPPFQYTENGKIIGASAEIVEAVFKKADVNYVIKSYPWARSYSMVQKQPNGFIFSISRQPAREALFKWVGIIVPARYSVFCAKDRPDIQLTSVDDMKKFKIGTTIDDARESYLVSHGFILANFDRTGGDTANIKNYNKLKMHRIDLWPVPNAVAYHIAKSQGDDPDTVIRNALPLTEISVGGYYIAASLSTPDTTVEKLRAALDSFVTTQKYKNILKKWGIAK